MVGGHDLVDDDRVDAVEAARPHDHAGSPADRSSRARGREAGPQRRRTVRRPQGGRPTERRPGRTRVRPHPLEGSARRSPRAQVWSSPSIRGSEAPSNVTRPQSRSPTCSTVPAARTDTRTPTLGSSRVQQISPQPWRPTSRRTEARCGRRECRPRGSMRWWRGSEPPTMGDGDHDSAPNPSAG